MLFNDNAFNTYIDKVDVKKFASNLNETGAVYFVLTLGQNSGFYLSPNKTYDDIMGVKPGEKTSLRDLPLELMEALQKYNIPLMLYAPIGSPCEDKEAMDKFDWSFGTASQKSQGLWKNVLEEWSRRYSEGVKGWWVDGCYTPNLYSDYSQKHKASFRK